MLVALCRCKIDNAVSEMIYEISSATDAVIKQLDGENLRGFNEAFKGLLNQVGTRASAGWADQQGLMREDCRLALHPRA